MALDKGKELKTRYQAYLVLDKFHALSLVFGVTDKKKWGSLPSPIFTILLNTKGVHLLKHPLSCNKPL